MTSIHALVAKREFAKDLPGFDEPCEGSKFHSPTPLVTYPYDLAAPDLAPPEKGKPKDPVRLCGVCRGNLGVFLMLTDSGDLEWEVQRQFGNRIRALGQRVIAHRGEA